MIPIISSHSGGLTSGIFSIPGLLPDDTLINISVIVRPVARKTEQIAWSVKLTLQIYFILRFNNTNTACASSTLTRKKNVSSKNGR